MLTVHHLSVSQSERIVWLCEELGLDYNLVVHTRDPQTHLSPESLTKIPGNDLAAAPLIQDGDLTLAESGAIAEYILIKYGTGKLVLGPEHKNFAQYLYWFHWSNGNLQAMGVCEVVRLLAGLPKDSTGGAFAWGRFEREFKVLNDRLKDNKWVAGDDFTAADIMCAYTPSTNRFFAPIDLTPYPHVVRWLQDCANRPAYKAAMDKGDPGHKRLIDARGPEHSIFHKA